MPINHVTLFYTAAVFTLHLADVAHSDYGLAVTHHGSTVSVHGNEVSADRFADIVAPVDWAECGECDEIDNDQCSECLVENSEV